MNKEQKIETITYSAITGNTMLVKVVCNWHGELVLVGQELNNK